MYSQAALTAQHPHAQAQQCPFLDKSNDPGRTRANWQQVWKLLSSLASHAERKVKTTPNGKLGIN